MADEQAAMAALEGAFGDGEPLEQDTPTQAAPETNDDPLTMPIEPPEGEATPEPVVAAEPEYEIEVDGQKQVVAGADQIKELLQKGAHYHKNSELNARIRDSLAAQYHIAQQSQQFQAAVFQDVVQLKAIDAQLEQFSKVDWQAAYDTDPFKAMQIKEQRDQLREQKNAMLQQLNAKDQQFKNIQAQATQHQLQAETAALVSKLPEMRNSETAAKVQQGIVKMLTSNGFNQAEIASVVDHRMIVIARKALLWDELQQGKDGKLKQVREAPPVVKPGPANANKPADMSKFNKALRSLGKNSDHRAQEALVTKAFDRVFK